MTEIFLPLAITFIKWYVGSGVFTRIENLVLEMTKSDLTNDDKRLFVIAAIKAEYETIRTRVIDMVIGAILTKLN